MTEPWPRTLLLVVALVAPGCFVPSTTVFHVRPAEPSPVQALRVPLVLDAKLESVEILRGDTSRPSSTEHIAFMVEGCRQSGLFRAVYGPEAGHTFSSEPAKLRFQVREEYRRNPLTNILKMFLNLVTLTASATVLPVTADLDQTMSLEMLLPNALPVTYGATSKTTHEMPVAGPTEDALHYVRVTATNLKSLLAQARQDPELRKWEAK